MLPIIHVSVQYISNIFKFANTYYCIEIGTIMNLSTNKVTLSILLKLLIIRQI